ncbi:MAG: ATP-binding cassette domain-containing protein [Candidatus Competibacteraceae bacterium]|nr:ATP-binding cassette domain-containing protein [Candidatus Competibacteraceae bacterium]
MTADPKGRGAGPTVLTLKDLKVRFSSPEGEVRAVNGVSLTVHPRETLGVVGESGSGKSQTFLAVMGLLAANGRVEGIARYRDRDLLGLGPRELDTIRGGRMTMIFQDPMTSLNPFLKVGLQLSEVLVRHLRMDRRRAQVRAVEMMERVQIPEAARRFHQYPHEFSGGMRQRVMVAMSLLCNPELLIADEPTTALDVTIQAQILELFDRLKADFDTAIVIITHDLGVVAELCDRVLVMYAGSVMEAGSVEEIFYQPQHPYTIGLLASTPRLDRTAHGELLTIPGQPPNLQRLPPVGCPFAHRCPQVFDRCRRETPLLREVGDPAGHLKACHLEPGADLNP